MSPGSSHVLLREPRVLLVLAGAASVGAPAATALEQATMPNLAALAARGVSGRLRVVAPHLAPEPRDAYAGLLGVVAPAPLDVGAVAAASAGAVLGAGERGTLIEVLDHAGVPAPALDVARAVEVIRGQLPHQRVAAVHRGHHVLLAGLRRPALPQVDGLQLRAAPAGWLPEHPMLDQRTVVVAAAGSAILGVAQVLGARPVAVDALATRPEAVTLALRSAAARELLRGAQTLVVESGAPLAARLRPTPPEAAREAAVAHALSGLDRGLIGPLRTLAAWCGAGLAVTADMPREGDGQPASGAVPLVVGGTRDVAAQAPQRQPAGRASAPPPAYSERGTAQRPLVTHALAVPFARDPDAPQRFTRDAATGVTRRVPAH